MTHEADTSNLNMALRMADQEAFSQPSKVPMEDLRQQYLNSKSDTDLRMSFGRWSVQDKVEWTCLQCTFSNQPLFLTCEMCGQARPAQDASRSNNSTRIRAAARGPMSSSSQLSLSSSEFGGEEEEAADLSPEELRQALLDREEEKLKQERFREIMALQQGMFGKIHEGTTGEEQQAHEENGEENNPRGNNEIEDVLEELEDSFSWMDLEDTLPIKELPNTRPSATTKANKFDASNATCTTAASSTSYLSLDGSSHHSHGVRRGTNSASLLSLDTSSHHSRGVRRGTMYPSPQEVSTIDGGVRSFHGSSSYFEDTRLSFGDGNSSYASLNFPAYGASQRSFASDCSSFLGQGGNIATGIDIGTAPPAADSSAISAATTAPEDCARYRGGPTMSAKVSRAETPPKSMPNLATTTVPSENRLKQSFTLQGKTPAKRSQRSTQFPALHPKLDEMPATPRDVPVPNIPSQPSHASQIPQKPTSLHASRLAPSPLRASLPTMSTIELSGSNAFRNSIGTNRGTVILPGNKKVALPPTHNPVFQKNLYSERNASGGSKDSSVGSIPILGRMLGRKKNNPSPQFPPNP